MSSSWSAANGLWSDAADWSAGVPTLGLEAVISGSAAFAITYNIVSQVSTVYDSDSAATLDITGGLLQASGWAWYGTVDITGGTLSIAGLEPNFYGPVTLAGGALSLAPASGYNAVLYDGLTQTGGTLWVADETLYLDGTLSSLNGTLAGGGALALGYGDAATLGTAAVLDIAQISLAPTALLAFTAPAAGQMDYVLADTLLAAPGSTLAGNGQVITLAGGGVAGATLSGGSTLIVAGLYDIGGLALTGVGGEALITGTAAQDYDAVTLGLSATDAESLTVATGGLYEILAPGADITGNSLASLAVFGTLQADYPATPGGAVDIVELGSFALAAGGTLAIGGALALEGLATYAHNTAVLAGTVSGGGALEIGAYETASVGGTALEVASLLIAASGTLGLSAAQSYQGTLLYGTGVINTNGAQLTLGSLATGTLANSITGGGTVLVAGNLFTTAYGPILSGAGTQLLLTGTLTETGPYGIVDVLGAGTTFAIATGGVLNLGDGAGLYSTGGATLRNAGLITADLGTPFTGPVLQDLSITNTGTLQIGLGQLQIEGGTALLGGDITGPGTLVLGSNIQATLAAGLTLATTGLDWLSGTITLGGDLTYGGTFTGGMNGTLNTQGHTLTATHGDLGAIVTGGGAVAVTGQLVEGNGDSIWLEGAGTRLLDQGSIVQDGGNVALGLSATDSPTLAIASGAQYVIENGNISAQGTASLLDNAGTLAVQALYPLSIPIGIASASLVNTGLIDILSGTAQINGALDNDGLVSISGVAELGGAIAADVGQHGTFVIANNATLGFTAAYLSNPTLSGAIAASQTIDFATGAGRLVIADPVSFAGSIEGFVSGDVIQLAEAANAFAYAGGVLTLQSVFATSPSTTSTIALSTLAVAGLNAANILLDDDQNNGGTDILLAGDGAQASPVENVVVYSSTWTGPSGADWGASANNWETQYNNPASLTNPQLELAFPPTGYEIVLNSGVLVYSAADGTYTGNELSQASGSTLEVTGGVLGFTQAINENGLLAISGGTFEAIDTGGGPGGGFSGVVETLDLFAGGVLQVDNGGLNIAGSNNGLSGTPNQIAGTVQGAGLIDLLDGTFSIAASADLTIATLVANAKLVVLTGNQSFDGTVFENLGGTVNLGGNTLSLGAQTTASLGGTFTNGTIIAAGATELGAYYLGVSGLQLVDAALLITGTAASGTGATYLGPGSSVTVAAGAVLDNPVFGAGTSNGTLYNAGLIELTGPGETLIYSYPAQFTNAATGTLQVDTHAALALDTTASLAGLITGGGLLELDTGSATLAANVSIKVATLALSGGADTLSANLSYNGVFNEEYATINAAGDSLALGSIGTLQDGLFANGTLVLNGDYFVSGLQLTGAGTEVLDEGTVLVGSGGIQNGIANSDNALISVAAGATLDFIDAGGASPDGASSFANTGLVADLANGLVSLDEAYLTNTGTISLASGAVLMLDSYTRASIGGLVTGAGTLELESAYNAALTLAAGLTMDQAALTLLTGTLGLGGNLTYAGAFLDTNMLLQTNGDTLALTGAGTLGGTLAGAGGLALDGSFVDSGNLIDWSTGSTLAVNGTLDITSALYAGGSGTSGAGVLLTVGSSGTLNLANDEYVGADGLYANVTLANAGLVEKTGQFGTASLVTGSFLNTGTIAVDTGTLDITGALVNDGVISEDAAGALILGGALSGTGTLIIDPAAMTLSSAVAAGQTIDFTGPGGTLVLEDAGQFAGTIAGFAAGDVIDLATLAPSAILSERYANNVLTLVESGASLALTITEPSGFSGSFALGSDAASGTAITLCFYPGTRLATPSGEVCVEALAAGDLLLTANGPRPLRWVGQSHVHLRFADPLRSLPVRIRAGALGEGLPRRDLLVSPDHALFLDGLLVQAGALVGLPGILRADDVPAQFTYYHLELDRHELLCAEGAWAESFVDNEGRWHFHNWDGQRAAALAELPYPRVKSARQLPASWRRRVARRA